MSDRSLQSLTAAEGHGHTAVGRDDQIPLQRLAARGGRVLVVDLEATCTDDGSVPPEQREVIEIGACWATPAGEVVETFQCFVRPVVHPTLTAFCTGLISIEQADVDGAPLFPEAAEALRAFAARHASESSGWTSWGAYDLRQLELDAARHGIAMPLAALPHYNAKRHFAQAQGGKPVGMAGALRRVGLPLEGTHHRGLDDARNVARLLPWVLGHARCGTPRRKGHEETRRD